MMNPELHNRLLRPHCLTTLKIDNIIHWFLEVNSTTFHELLLAIAILPVNTPLIPNMLVRKQPKMNNIPERPQCVFISLLTLRHLALDIAQYLIWCIDDALLL